MNTLIGAIIALVGSISAQWFYSYLERKREKIAILREKLEKIGYLANEFEEALQKDMAQVLGVADPSDTNIPPVSHNLNVLSLNVRLYCPSLIQKLEELEKACHSEYLSEKREIKQKVMKDKRVVSSPQKIKDGFQNCIRVKKDLVNQLVEVKKSQKLI